MPYLNIHGFPHYYEWITADDAKGPSGQKPVMVFVHGWGGSGRYWQSTAQALCDQYDCLIYDLRGFGRSSSPGDRLPPSQDHSYQMEVYAEELNQLLDQLHLPQVTINAHSMGGSIATLFASQYPQRLNQLILTCMGVFEYDPITFPLFHRIGTWVTSIRPQWLSQLPGVDRLFIARFIHLPLDQADRKAFLEDYLQAAASAVAGTIYTSVSKHASEVMPLAFQALQIPTLLIAGEKDIIIPPPLGQRAASLNPQVHYIEIPRTAHFPMLEDPVTYRHVLQTFLEPDPSAVGNPS
jgi:proline iminopeptidase